jgi:hypothetical protein
LVQWFTDFYAQKHSSPPFEFIQQPGSSPFPPPLQSLRIQNAIDVIGDLVFIPSGWWHSVINLEESIAVTQNFVSRRNLKKVYRFLKSKPSQELFNIFVENLRRHELSVLADVEAEIAAEEESSSSVRKESMEWTSLVEGDTGESWTLGL